MPFTFRLVPFGGSGPSGTWYLCDTAASPAADLVLDGTNTELHPPAEPPQRSTSTRATGQIAIALAGTARRELRP